MKNKLVSIIVPTYNGEKHLAATLESIIAQDYENLEIILVNDASTDDTLNVSEKILKNSGRTFKIINHKKNSGVSVSRNDGLEASNGEYICFCDSDDLTQKNYVSKLMQKILENNCEISFCGMIDTFKDERPDRFIYVNISKSNKIINGDEALSLSVRRPVARHIGCMMFEKKFLIDKKLRFHEGCSAFEDIEFQLKAFCRAEKISFTPKCLYVYVHSSMMGSVRDNDTEEKKLRRYIHSTEAHERAAEYLDFYAPSERVRFLAQNLLMPEAAVRKFTVAARMNDKEKYDFLCHDQNLREILTRTKKSFFKKPELFFKALMILYAPKLYYKFRKKKKEKK